MKNICWLLIINVIALFAIGITVQYSSVGGKWSHFLIQQLAVFCISLPLVIIAVQFIEIESYAYLIYTATIALLIAVNYFGLQIMGATRWIKVGFFTFQPSEFTKVGLILALARYFHNQSVYKMREFRKLLTALIITLLPIVLVLKQPNLGTAIIMLFIGASIIFTATIKRLHLAICGILSVCAAPALWPFLRNYHKQRILSFLNPSADPLGIGYNAHQSQIAIGSGGLLGKGFISGSQTQLHFLPERRTDFAFAVLSEEWGFCGSMTFILLYTLLLGTIFIVAIRSKDYFSKFVSIGVFAFFSANFFINIGMNIGILPIIGDPLPFLSYGGSITLASLICIGLLFSDKTQKKEEAHFYIRKKKAN
ncbi:MAG: rod shape-determining protein RodA [Wolbachia endosymbiont of Tyrophagus putrescentiae]|nr:rod shape-determining protein RodA [Wolbachia endosymbiont of Tyrophagus putrescentiae]